MVPSLFTAGISEEDAQTRATSSMTMQVASASAPTPSYSSGMCGAWKSDATRASWAACGYSPVSSTSAACGAILSCATARTASRRASWSSEMRNRSKAALPVLTDAQATRWYAAWAAVRAWSRCGPGHARGGVAVW